MEDLTVCATCGRTKRFCVCGSGYGKEDFLWEAGVSERVCFTCGGPQRTCLCAEYDNRYNGECPDCHEGNCLCMQTVKKTAIRK